MFSLAVQCHLIRPNIMVYLQSKVFGLHITVLHWFERIVKKSVFFLNFSFFQKIDEDEFLS